MEDSTCKISLQRKGANVEDKMITSVRFCLSYDLLNVILSLSKFVYFHKNLHCSSGRRSKVTCSRRKFM